MRVALATAIALLMLGCGDAPVIEPVEPLLVQSRDAEVGEDEAELRYDEAELARSERTFEWDPSQDILPSAVQRGAAVRAVRARRAMSPEQLAQVREQGWNLEAHPESLDALREATISGLHRISASEVEWGNENDLFGIWEVVRNIRSRSCDNTRFSSSTRVLITQCQTEAGALVTVGPEDVVAGARETHLSAMRRLSRYVMGMAHSRTRIRTRWTAHVNLDCEEPEDFPTGRSWAGLRANCLEHAALARQLVEGDLHRDVTGRARAIAWGGRCGRPGFACDDPNACRRGLAAITGTETSNRLWCRPGTVGCTPWVERNGLLYSDQLCASIQISPNQSPSRLGRVVPWINPGRTIPSTTERVDDAKDIVEDETEPLAVL